MKEKKDEKNEKIKIVKGHTKDLNISDVRDNLTFEVHKNDTKEHGEIIIPENKD